VSVALRRVRTWLATWWPVLLLGCTTIGAYGAVYYSFGVLLTPMRDATGWSTGALSGGFSLSVLLGGACAVLAGRVVDRAGARLVLAVSLAVGCAGLLAASYAEESWQFVAGWAIGGGAVAGGLYYNVTMALTARLYPAQRPAAFSILTLLGALAGPIFYPYAGWLVETFEWRTALRLLVLALAVSAAPAAILVRVGPGQRAPEATDSRRDGSVRAALSDRRIVTALIMMGTVSLGTSALTLHQVPAMQATGISLAAASGIAGTRGFFQFGGRVFLSPLIARLGLVGALGAAYAVSAAGTGLLAAAGSIVLVFAFIAMTGVALGLLSPLHGLFAAEVYGEARLGTLMGVQQIVVSVSGAAGPWIAGVALDATGSYAPVLLAAAALQLGGLGALVAQRRAAGNSRA
jgi:MFS family permease